MGSDPYPALERVQAEEPAALVDVTAANLSGVNRPLTTPSENSIGNMVSRSATPGSRVVMTRPGPSFWSRVQGA